MQRRRVRLNKDIAAIKNENGGGRRVLMSIALTPAQIVAWAERADMGHDIPFQVIPEWEDRFNGTMFLCSVTKILQYQEGGVISNTSNSLDSFKSIHLKGFPLD